MWDFHCVSDGSAVCFLAIIFTSVSLSLSLSLFLFPFFILLGSSPQKFSLKKREAKECCLYILPFNEQESRASVEQPLFHLVSVKTAEVFDKSGSQHHGASKTSSGGGGGGRGGGLFGGKKKPTIFFL